MVGKKMKMTVEMDKNDIEDAIFLYLKGKHDKHVPHNGRWVITDYDAKNKTVDFVYCCELTKELGR